MVVHCSTLPLLLICLPLISSLALAELAGTQAPFSKTIKHKRLLRMCFESTGFSSDWVAANYPPCNYGDPRSKQMGKSFVFKWRRNQYVGRKGSLFIWTDSRWLVASRQRTGEPGLALDPSDCPQARGATATTGLASAHLTALHQVSCRSGGQGTDNPQRPWRAGSQPEGHWNIKSRYLLLFHSNTLVYFIRKENSRKNMQKPKPYGKPLWTALIIWSFAKPKVFLLSWGFYQSWLLVGLCLLRLPFMRAQRMILNGHHNCFYLGFYL